MFCASLVTLSLGAFPAIPTEVEKQFDSLGNFIAGASSLVAETIDYKETIKANIPDCNSIPSNLRSEFVKEVLNQADYAFPKTCQTSGLKALCDIGKGSDELIQKIKDCETTVSDFVKKIEDDVSKDWDTAGTCFDDQAAKGSEADYDA